MEIIKNLNDSSLTLKIIGRLDTTTSPEAESVIKANIEGITDLCFDLEGLDYISSAGLRVFLSIQKIMNKQGQLKLINVKPEVMEILEVTGFVDILTIV